MSRITATREGVAAVRALDVGLGGLGCTGALTPSQQSFAEGAAAKYREF